MASISRLLLDLWIQAHSPVVIQSANHSENTFQQPIWIIKVSGCRPVDFVLGLLERPRGVASHRGGSWGCTWSITGLFNAWGQFSEFFTFWALPHLTEMAFSFTDREPERGNVTWNVSHSYKWGPQTRPSGSRAKFNYDLKAPNHCAIGFWRDLHVHSCRVPHVRCWWPESSLTAERVYRIMGKTWALNAYPSGCSLPGCW